MDARRPTRRELLAAGGAGAATLALGGLLPGAGAFARNAKLGGYPFQAGVASGEPAADGFVLWTKLALDEFAGQYLPAQPIPVSWEVASDEHMRRVVRRGRVTADPRENHALHVEVDGLQPGHEYFYRFYTGGEASATGRTRTAPGYWGGPDELRYCFVSCSQFEHGYFTAYARVIDDDPAFVVHVGDYIYEYGTDVYKAPGGNVRHHVGGETNTLADYRRRYA